MLCIIASRYGNPAAQPRLLTSEQDDCNRRCPCSTLQCGMFSLKVRSDNLQVILQLDEIQRQARSETSEARSELDQIARGLHAATLEAQGSNQAAADARAAVRPSRVGMSVLIDWGCVLIAGTSRINGTLRLYVANSRQRLIYRHRLHANQRLLSRNIGRSLNFNGKSVN